MGLFSFLSRWRASSDDRSPWGDFWFEPVTVRTSSGMRVSADNELRVAAVYASVRKATARPKVSRLAQARQELEILGAGA